MRNKVYNYNITSPIDIFKFSIANVLK